MQFRRSFSYLITLCALNIIPGHSSEPLAPENPYSYRHDGNSSVVFVPLPTNLRPLNTTYEDTRYYRVYRNVVSWADGYYAHRTDDFTTYDPQWVNEKNQAKPIGWRRFAWDDFQQRNGDIYPKVPKIQFHSRTGIVNRGFSLDPFGGVDYKLYTHEPIITPHPVQKLEISLGGMRSFIGHLEVLGNLTVLKLDNCSFTNEGVNFRPLKNLRKLSLINNELTLFPANLPSSLVRLDLSFNKITYVEIGFIPEAFTKLKQIDLFENRLFGRGSNFSVFMSYLSIIPNLDIVLLHGNPIRELTTDISPLLYKGVTLTFNSYAQITPGLIEYMLNVPIHEFIPSVATTRERQKPMEWNSYTFLPPPLLTLPGKLVTANRGFENAEVAEGFFRNGFLGSCSSERYTYTRQKN